MRHVSTIVYFLFLLIKTGFCQEVKFRKITSNHGLSHNTVYAITQDETGFMWFGTREGLNRFDSYDVKNYYIKDSQPGGSANKISTLLCLQSKVYAGTDNGLYEYDSRTDQLKASKSFPNKVTVLFLVEEGGVIYIGSNAGLYQLYKGRTKLLSQPNIAARAMCIISEGRFLFYAGKFLQIINQHGKVLRVFKSEALAELSKPDFSVFSIYRDFKGMVWLSTNYGLFNYNTESQRFSRVRFSGTETQESNTVRSIIRDRQNKLFIGTENGLYTYDIASGKTANYQQSFNNDPKRLNDKAIYSTYIAKDGSVWIGTYFGGINYISGSSYGFKSLMANDNGAGLSGKAVSEIMEDSRHRLWIGTEDGGITTYDPARNSYSYINKNSSPFYLTINNVHAIHDDGYGNIWIGTFLGGLHQFDTRKNITKVYTNTPEDRSSLSNDQVYAVYRDSRGKLWVATQKGLNLFDYKTGKFSLFRPEVLGNKFVYDITEDKNGHIWICTRYNGIYRYRPEEGNLFHYTASNNNAVLASNQVISVYKDSKQQLWFGTLDGGVSCYNIDKDQFKNYTIADGLPNNNVYGILEDDSHGIWMSTNRGISRLDLRNNSFTNFDTRYGLPSNQFNFKSFLKSSDGTLYFGSINGLSFFDTAAITAGPSLIPLMFTDFQLFNQSVVPGDSSLLLNQIDHTEELSLPHNQNVFTLSFAAINFANPGSTNYAYYLEGFESTWNFVKDRKSVTYTNLSPGEYVFHVKALDASGITRSFERTLKIHIIPPFYQSTPAYILYILIIASLIWLYNIFLKFLHQKKLELKLERVEKEKIREITQNRLNFFTFISHEFKTPLTLILASIDKFTEDKGVQFKRSTELSIIKNNASILFKLIQQLMEFRKIETDHTKIELSRCDIVDFIRNAVFSFATIASKKETALNFSSPVATFECYIDKDKIEKIILNLISNAVKNTSKGKIDVILNIKELDQNSKSISVYINDTGRGMSAKELKNIFNPFDKAADSPDGSGIGLALVQSLIQYLGGNISVESELHIGTSMKVDIPVLLDTDDGVSEKGNHIAAAQDLDLPQQMVSDLPVEDGDIKAKYTLLIVEDNKELLNFLSQHFSKTYQVATASNGLIAFRKINKNPPDIIISDVKMPRMDGLELCSKIKSDKRFSYIPVILLSDSDRENIKLNGLDVGADAYLSKPFNLKEFELLISNMIRSRVVLREHVAGLGEFLTLSLPDNNKDQEFLAKLGTVLEREFSNPKITIDGLAKELNMSRTSLHLNLKRVLNKSATELLNEYRLKRATIMLGNNMPVNEVAYFCGYSDPNYFARIFKKHFNESPIKYKERTVNLIETPEIS